jgi:hypothetical protein
MPVLGTYCLARLIILVTVAVDTPHSFGNFNEYNPMIYYQTNRNQGCAFRGPLVFQFLWPRASSHIETETMTGVFFEFRFKKAIDESIKYVT